MILDTNDRIIIKTKSIPVAEDRTAELEPDEIFHSICESIREGGYNPVTQIIGYIVSEDPTHVTNYKGARTLIGKLDRDELLEKMVTIYIESIDKKFADKEEK